MEIKINESVEWVIEGTKRGLVGPNAPLHSSCLSVSDLIRFGSVAINLRNLKAAFRLGDRKRGISVGPTVGPWAGKGGPCAYVR